MHETRRVIAVGIGAVVLALAAYNVGRAHLHDAQVLARRHGLSPWRWRDIKQMLPVLAEPKYYRTLKYGYARGHEPVRYVQRIREYHHVLANELIDEPVTAIPHQAAFTPPDPLGHGMRLP